MLLPASLGTTPVKVTRGAAWVAFSLAGATGTGSLQGATDTFRGALPSTDASYTALPSGVKEALVLQNAGAPASFGYTVKASPGLRTRREDAGIEFVNASGRSVFFIPAPTVSDHAGIAGRATMTLSREAGGIRLTVSLDPAWLQSPARSFPVVVDPSITTLNPTQDCSIVSGTSANTSLCGG